MLVVDFAEFSGAPIEVVNNRIANFRQLNQQDFASFTSDGEFYKQSRSYIYDSLGGPITTYEFEQKLEQFIPGFVKILRQAPCGDFLDFGAGVGLACEWVVRQTQLRVTHFDIQSYMSEFAAWRYKKYQLPVTMIHGEPHDFTLPQQYSVIFTDAVWEHLDPEKQIYYAYKLSDYLINGGILCMLVDLSGKSATMPMHYDVDIVAVHNALAQTMNCIFGRNTFASIWIRKTR